MIEHDERSLCTECNYYDVTFKSPHTPPCPRAPKPGPFSGLTPAQAERLALLAEEAAEVVQAVTKILRHGYENWNPVAPEHITNRTQLEKELGDLMCAINILEATSEIDLCNIDSHAAAKRKSIRQWLHHHE